MKGNISWKGKWTAKVSQAVEKLKASEQRAQGRQCLEKEELQGRINGE